MVAHFPARFMRGSAVRSVGATIGMHTQCNVTSRKSMRLGRSGGICPSYFATYSVAAVLQRVEDLFTRSPSAEARPTLRRGNQEIMISTGDTKRGVQRVRRRYELAVLTLFGLFAFGRVAARDDLAGTLPVLKSGTWRMVMTSGVGSTTMVMCVGQSAAPAMAIAIPWSGLSRPGCRGLSVTPTADGVLMTASCPTRRGGVVSLKGVLTGDIETGFKYETDNAASGSPNARDIRETRTVTTGVWLGPCPPGQAPGAGTIKMPNGATLTVKPRSQ